MKEHCINSSLDELGRLILIPEIIGQKPNQEVIDKKVEDIIRMWVEDLEKYM
ncbi:MULTISPECIES: hypothetical protein [Flavobacterium]|uniref:hypothetical protein n=1 Tax=Flavobacterium TaxID=237 RepID=UPI0021145915|nr:MULTISPECIES: hypothetical protein [Flavobacterium]UUF15165.1 hypothetical protein NLJ00_03455 [Flavobacterium panici]